MSGRHEVTEQADQDLFDISLYLARMGSIEPAERFIDAINSKFALLADNPGMNPGMGRAREELSPGVRSFPEGKYVIFYRAASDGILILRVLHGSRDIDSLFGPG